MLTQASVVILIAQCTLFALHFYLYVHAVARLQYISEQSSAVSRSWTHIWKFLLPFNWINLFECTRKFHFLFSVLSGGLAHIIDMNVIFQFLTTFYFYFGCCCIRMCYCILFKMGIYFYDPASSSSLFLFYFIFCGLFPYVRVYEKNIFQKQGTWNILFYCIKQRQQQEEKNINHFFRSYNWMQSCLQSAFCS